jgi:Cft2 family RNA processing exonuclease
MVGVPYGLPFTPLPGVRAEFIEAGHILGSAQAVLDTTLEGGPRRGCAGQRDR